MNYNALSLFQAEHAFRVQQRSIATTTRANNWQISPKIEMIVGRWYIDELGNPTREIRARD